MISAREARLETVNYKTVQKFHSDIELNINKAIKDGKYCTQVLFDCEMPDSIRDSVKEELEELGYKVSIPKYEEKLLNCPVDQWKYYDQIIISWSEFK